MKALILTLLACSRLIAQDSGISEATRSKIEKAILEVNAEMARVSEDRDIDGVFSFVLPNNRGSMILNGNLFLTRDAALAAVKGNSGRGATVKYTWKNLMVTVLSPTAAVLVADGESAIRTAENPDNPIKVPFAQTVLFVLADGKWRVLHANQSAQPR